MKRATLILSTLTLLLGVVGQAKANMIVNGGFETGDFSGWTITVSPFASFMNVFQSAGGFAPHGGTYLAQLGDPVFPPFFIGGTLSQTISDTAGQSYTLSLYLGSDGRTPSEFKIQWNGTTLSDQTILPSTVNNTNQYNLLTYTVTGTGSDTLSLFERNDSGYLYLDDVSLDPVTSTDSSATPAPSSLVLLGLAIVTFAGYHGWRRRKQLVAA